MHFTYFYIRQGKSFETWFVSLANREYVGVEPTNVNKLTKKLFPGKMNC